MKFPKKGTPREQITARMKEYRGEDADSANPKLFSLVYFTRPDVLEVAKEAYNAFFSENALNPMAFPSLRRMEHDVVAMTLSMLNAPEGAAGTMSSGGSESLLLAVKTARDWARAERPHVTAPEMILPVTAHPALLKAAHMTGVKPVLVPTTPAFTADVEAVKRALNDNTILIVGSAPQYPHGVMDPIADLARLADERGILCHVDACIGGFVLPWVEKLGYPVPPFDFRVKGVTSISADLHKYGYAAKGASTITYRSRALRKYQYFAHGDWPGGLFASPSVLGTRPGGAIAAAWAVMNYLGEEGYLELTRRAMAATKAIMSEVREIPGLHVVGEPVASCIAIGGDDSLDLYVLSEKMEARGWRLDKQQLPASLHLTVSPGHDAIVPELMRDLAACTKEAREAKARGEQPQGSAAMYGMLGSLPDRTVVTSALLDFMDGLDAS
jgi:glutamate/tyrosine decarboxylase-like PLP-dependent enzyme